MHTNEIVGQEALPNADFQTLWPTTSRWSNSQDVSYLPSLLELLGSIDREGVAFNLEGSDRVARPIKRNCSTVRDLPREKQATDPRLPTHLGGSHTCPHAPNSG